MRRKNIIRIIIGTALILLGALLAMLFTDEVRWDWFDFAVIGTLLIGTGLTFEVVSSMVDARYRPVIAVIFLAALLVVWAELAVGIFGSPIAGS